MSFDSNYPILLDETIVSTALPSIVRDLGGLSLYGWIGLWAIGAGLLILFIYVESKAKEPILPLGLFKNRTFVMLSLIVFTLVLGVMSAFAAFPLA